MHLACKFFYVYAKLFKLGECSALWGELSELQGALAFHRKSRGKRLGHQMYMPVFVEECSMHGYVLILGSLYTLCWVSLIAGVGYRVEYLGGKQDRTMGVANSCNWRCCSRLC